MYTPFELALKIAASVSVGLFIGLERQWAHKEAGERTFAIATLLGTIAWLVTPVMAYVQFSVVLLAIIIINLYSIWKTNSLLITTSFALAAANVLGILIGIGDYFLAFACAILIMALLSWKTELVTFTSKLTEAEISGTLLLAFIAVVVYPLLPNRTIDPWHIVNPREVWLTVVLVSGLNFLNYVLLRQFGTRGIRYSALLGGLVNSAATALFLGQETRDNIDTTVDASVNILLSDVAMILRNWALVLIFVLPRGIQPALATIVTLVPMMLVAAIIAFTCLHFTHKNRRASATAAPQTSPNDWRPTDEQRDRKPTTATKQTSEHDDEQQHKQAGVSPQPAHNTQQSPEEQRQLLRSPLSLRSVLTFGLLFLLLTVLSGLAKIIFGTLGFLVVIVVGALASAASSSVLVGQELAQGAVSSTPAAVTMLLATIVGLLENVVIFWALSRKSGLRLLLLTLPIIATGVLAIFLERLLGL